MAHVPWQTAKFTRDLELPEFQELNISTTWPPPARATGHSHPSA